MYDIMRINARLGKKEAETVTYLKEKTKQSVTEIIKRALNLYAESIREQESNCNAKLLNSGFVGCVETSQRNLSENYKEEIKQNLDNKYDNS